MASPSPVEFDGATVDGVEAPLGVGPSPRFAWRLRSPRVATRQSAYRLVVASTGAHAARGRGDVWDSGVVPSDRSVDVRYAGPALAPRTDYFWAVRVWDDVGTLSDWSPVRTFGTAVFDPSAWTAHWIGGVRDVHSENDSGTPRLRRAFDLDGDPVRARLRVAALGFADVRLNGRDVSPDRFTSTWTDYRARVQYRTYDVAGLLVPGRNALAAQLAPGYYAGYIPAPVARERYYGDHPLVFAELVVDFADGSSRVIVTDGSWRTAPSEIVEADLFHGEARDARRADPGWDSAGFDDRTWAAATVDDAAIGAARLSSQIGPAVRVAGELSAVEVTEPQPGRFVVDFGQNIAGWVRLTAVGEAGSTVVIRHGEVLNPDGTVYTRNLRAARATDRFTFAGTGSPETFEPRFTYHGFRYAELTGLAAPLERSAVTAVVAHADLRDTLQLVTSDPLVNDLQRALERTLLNDMAGYPTDCHQRDERLPWISMDMVGFAATMVANVSGEAYYAEWLRTVADAQLPHGGFPDIAVGVELGEAASGASELLVVLAHALWQEHGSTRAADENWEAIRRYLSFAAETAPDGLTTRRGWSDWISVGEETNQDVTAQAFFARAAVLAADLADASGRSEGARYRALAEQARRRFVETYVDDVGRVRGDSQTAYVLALAFDLVPDDLRPVLADHLVANIRNRGTHLTTGFVGTHDLLSVLSATGHDDIAYALIQRTEFPSWGYMIERGATTLWERWDSIHPDGSYAENDPPVPEMNSFNHYGYGGFGRWLMEVVGGLVREEPGYRRFSLRPRPGGGLTSTDLRHDTPYGLIGCAWHVTPRGLDLRVEVPVNTTATVHVPAPSRDAVAGVSTGADYVGTVDGHVVFEVGSGRYSFMVRG